MQLKLYASLRKAAGTKSVDFALESTTLIGAILKELTHSYPVLHPSIWAAEGKLVDYVHVFVNGENIRILQGLDTPVKPDDKVDVFPPVVGG